MRTLIENATIVNEGKTFCASIVISNGRITDIKRPKAQSCTRNIDQYINAEGMYLIPGMIDDHVHFREPGLTDKATIHSESRAAAAGGVTSFMDMPNTNPQTTTIAALKEKFAIAARESLINYSFYFGATNNNIKQFSYLNPRRVCGIKVFMGSSTGNILVEDSEALDNIFSVKNLPIAVHCEDGDIIAENTRKVTDKTGGNPPVEYHPVIRSNAACYKSTKKAVETAQRLGTRLNIMHISTREEIGLLYNADYKRITAEVTPAHLLFCSEDYKRLGTKIKCNPAIKSRADRDALRRAVNEGYIDIIGTDHAPHLPADKEGGALTAASGIPSIQFSLPAMLSLVDEKVFSIETVVEKMCHAPARIFDIYRRGFIRKGYFADLVLLRPDSPHTITKNDVLSKCGWSPFEGETFRWQVAQIWVNGECVYRDGVINEEVRGKRLTFRQ